MSRYLRAFHPLIADGTWPPMIKIECWHLMEKCGFRQVFPLKRETPGRVAGGFREWHLSDWGGWAEKCCRCGRSAVAVEESARRSEHHRGAEAVASASAEGPGGPRVGSSGRSRSSSRPAYPTDPSPD